MFFRIPESEVLPTRMKVRGLLIIWTIILSSCSLTATTPDQSTTASTGWSSILVCVKDHNGSTVPGATVVLDSAVEDSALVELSDANGVVRFSMLPPCTDCYLRISLAGFSNHEIGPIEFGAGETLEFEIELELGQGPFEVTTDSFPSPRPATLAGPNISFQADRDPRERGPRPLNSNR